MKLRPVVFDLDGTLIDSRNDIAAACNRTLVAAGRTPLSADVIATFVGDGARALVERAFGGELDERAMERHLAFFWTTTRRIPRTTRFSCRASMRP